MTFLCMQMDQDKPLIQFEFPLPELLCIKSQILVALLCVYIMTPISSYKGHMANKRISSTSMEKTALENLDDDRTHSVVEEKNLKSSDDDEQVLLSEINKEGDVNRMVQVKQKDNSRKRLSSATNDDLTSISHEDQLRSTKAKIVEVREENEKLKQLLSKIVKDYQSLQKNFRKVVREEEGEKPTKIMPTIGREDEEEPELVTLSLGRSSSNEPREEEKKSSNLSNGNDDGNQKGLSLSLDCKFEPDSSVTVKNLSSENSFDEERKEDEPTETWPPKRTTNADEEVLQQNQIKRTRVSVRTRCDAPTMHDGCQWRKYGQKIAKGNPCPRAYYRCTGSQTCPVRKQVQRCAQDMSILITTYEGSHNHPLPVSATAMASTTSAAVSMLESRSSSSSNTSSTFAPTSISSGLNFTFSQNSSKPHQQFYLPNSSFSSSGSHPTIVLDLTSAPSTTHISPHFNRFSSVPRCLNFSSSSLSSTSLDHNLNALQSLWNSTSLNRNYVEKQVITQDHHHSHHPYMQIDSQSSLTDSIVAATKAIASNPTFRSALAASITSIVGKTGGNGSTINPSVEDHYSSLSLKLGGHQHHQSLAFNALHPSSNNNE